MGAHTEYGGYIIDYRKVRNFAVPDLTDFNVCAATFWYLCALTDSHKLTPFVTREMEPKPRQYVVDTGEIYTPTYVDPMNYLREWKQQNPNEYTELLEFQQMERKKKEETKVLREAAAKREREARIEEEERLKRKEAAIEKRKQRDIWAKEKEELKRKEEAASKQKKREVARTRARGRTGLIKRIALTKS